MRRFAFIVCLCGLSCVGEQPRQIVAIRSVPARRQRQQLDLRYATLTYEEPWNVTDVGSDAEVFFAKLRRGHQPMALTVLLADTCLTVASSQEFQAFVRERSDRPESVQFRAGDCGVVGTTYEVGRTRYYIWHDDTGGITAVDFDGGLPLRTRASALLEGLEPRCNPPENDTTSQ